MLAVADELLLPPQPKSAPVGGAEGMEGDLKGLDAAFGAEVEVEGAGSGVAQASLEAQGSGVVKVEKADGVDWGWAGWGGGAGAERLNTEVR